MAYWLTAVAVAGKLLRNYVQHPAAIALLCSCAEQFAAKQPVVEARQQAREGPKDAEARRHSPTGTGVNTSKATAYERKQTPLSKRPNRSGPSLSLHVSQKCSLGLLQRRVTHLEARKTWRSIASGRNRAWLETGRIAPPVLGQKQTAKSFNRSLAATSTAPLFAWRIPSILALCSGARNRHRVPTGWTEQMVLYAASSAAQRTGLPSR